MNLFLEHVVSTIRLHGLILFFEICIIIHCLQKLFLALFGAHSQILDVMIKLVKFSI